MYKKIVSVLLAFVMLVGIVGVSASAAEAEARLYSVYGNGMLFAQNKDAVFAGEGEPGSIIKVQLLNENAWPIRTATSKVSSDGTFEVSFVAPAGGYKEYTVVLTQDNDEFATLENVVFGELWLASGQSNMQFPLIQSLAGMEMLNRGEMSSKWIRVLVEPDYPTYNGTNAIPLEPQNDIIDAKWISGETHDIYFTSAVAYFFAAELMDKLDIPVGIIDSSLGGTSIRSWLSREAIDADNILKSELKDNGMYIEETAWNENGADIYNDMTANYNLRTHAHRHFRPSGVIWYQGETDLIQGKGCDLYSHSFDALQQMYTDIFEYKEGFLPIVYTQIAPYEYPDYVLPEWNCNYTQLQSALPEYRAMVAISDLTLTYPAEAGIIHPSSKQPVGKRMANAALGMVYGKTDTYTAASFESSEIKDGCIYITLKNCGDGLIADGSFINGFAICGEDGVYVQAQAEIVSANTVKVWCEDIPSPVSASYAYCPLNTYANLYSTLNAEKYLPVSTFVTKQSNNAVYWSDKTWAECELDKAWHFLPDPYSAEIDTWEAEGAEVSIDNGSSYSGENGLSIKATTDNFIVNPVQFYKIDGKDKQFSDFFTDWSNYGKISFMARNNGTTPVTLNEMKIYADKYSWYTPVIDGTSDSSFVLPADGEWHEITLDLDSLYLFGNECGFTYANEKLSSALKFEFIFSSSEGNADISLDQFRFSASAAQSGTRFEADTKEADNVFEFISAIFTEFIAFFANLFT